MPLGALMSVGLLTVREVIGVGEAMVNIIHEHGWTYATDSI